MTLVEHETMPGCLSAVRALRHASGAPQMNPWADYDRLLLGVSDGKTVHAVPVGVFRAFYGISPEATMEEVTQAMRRFHRDLLDAFGCLN